jgi:methylmalonyl-CoA/ethylmalonyl-CoA epimerase
VLGHAFHHIGIACADIEATAAFVLRAYEIVSDSGTVDDPLQRARVRLFNAGLPGALELVAGPMVERLVKRGITYYHVCYETPDIVETMRRAEALRMALVSPPTPASLFAGRRVAFVYTDVGLIEFLEAYAPESD